jgi:hypothetical protein
MRREKLKGTFLEVIFHHLPFNENNSPAIAEMNARAFT